MNEINPWMWHQVFFWKYVSKIQALLYTNRACSMFGEKYSSYVLKHHCEYIASYLVHWNFTSSTNARFCAEGRFFYRTILKKDTSVFLLPSRKYVQLLLMFTVNEIHIRQLENMRHSIIKICTAGSSAMMTSSNGNIFRLTGHLCGDRSSVNSPYKDKWRGALIFFICTRINGYVNNRKAGDLRRALTHYDVTVMHILYFEATWNITLTDPWNV